MKSSTVIAAALVRLAAGELAATVTTWVSAPTATAPVAQPTGTGGSSSGAAQCGQGYTYCGYILRDHQGFEEADIVKAYCDSSKEACTAGKTKTDPMEALFVCLPQSSASSHHQNSIDMSENHNNHFVGLGRGRLRMHGNRQAPPAPQPSSGTCQAGSAPTTGNKLQMLCSCGGKCLNPTEDHIGRCDAPCA